MKELFSEILYRPLINLVVVLYNAIPGGDLGLAIIALTVLIRGLFLPLSLKTARSQRSLNVLQPKVNELKQKHKDDHMAQSQAIMALYKEHKINPLSGCLPLLVQIPVLLALYQVFLHIFQPESLDLLYGFIANPGTLDKTLVGLVDLSVRSPILAVLAGGFQFLQAKLTIQKQPDGKAAAQGDFAGALNKQMLYFFPVMLIIISWNLPAGLTLYWVTTTFFSIAEQLYIRRSSPAVS